METRESLEAKKNRLINARVEKQESLEANSKEAQIIIESYDFANNRFAYEDDKEKYDVLNKTNIRLKDEIEKIDSELNAVNKELEIISKEEQIKPSEPEEIDRPKTSLSDFIEIPEIINEEEEEEKNFNSDIYDRYLNFYKKPNENKKSIKQIFKKSNKNIDYKNLLDELKNRLNKFKKEKRDLEKAKKDSTISRFDEWRLTNLIDRDINEVKYEISVVKKMKNKDVTKGSKVAALIHSINNLTDEINVILENPIQNDKEETLHTEKYNLRRGYITELERITGVNYKKNHKVEKIIASVILATAIIISGTYLIKQIKNKQDKKSTDNFTNSADSLDTNNDYLNTTPVETVENNDTLNEVDSNNNVIPDQIIPEQTEINPAYNQEYVNVMTEYNLTEQEAIEIVNRAHDLKNIGYFGDYDIYDTIEVINAIANDSLADSNNFDSFNILVEEYNHICFEYLNSGKLSDNNLNKLTNMKLLAIKYSDAYKFLETYGNLLAAKIKNPNDENIRVLYEFVNTFANNCPNGNILVENPDGLTDEATIKNALRALDMSHILNVTAPMWYTNLSLEDCNKFNAVQMMYQERLENPTCGLTK